MARAAILHSDTPREMARSFVAGGLYAAGIAGGAIAVLTGMSYAMLPAIADSLAPSPKYVANQLHRAERWNPDQWKFDTDSSREIREALAKNPDSEPYVEPCTPNTLAKFAEGGDG